MRSGAAVAIREAIRDASPDDRSRLRSLFGPDPMERFDQVSWASSIDYLNALLARDPELPVEALATRQSRFLACIEDLDSCSSAESRLAIRYGGPCSCTLFDVFLQIGERDGGPLGWYRDGDAAYHLDLHGGGFVTRGGAGDPERYDGLADGVWIHAALDPDAAGTTVVLRATDRAALARVERFTRSALAQMLWTIDPGA